MALIQRVSEKFENLDVMEQGRIMYMMIALDEMFYVTQDVVISP